MRAREPSHVPRAPRAGAVPRWLRLLPLAIGALGLWALVASLPPGAARNAALGSAAAASSATPETGSAARRLAYPDTLPAGDGQALAGRWCTLCHSAMLITQQAKDSTGWEKTLAQMEKWGVTLSPAEHDTLRSYLLERFGARIPAAR